LNFLRFYYTCKFTRFEIKPQNFKIDIKIKSFLVNPEHLDVAIVIPTTLNRTDTVVRHIRALSKSSLKPHIFLVFASNDELDALHEYIDNFLPNMRKTYNDISCIVLTPDYGFSLSAYVGMYYVYKLGFHVISITDDDAIPLSKSFIKEIYNSAKDNLIVQPKNIEYNQCMLTNHYKTVERSCIKLAGYPDPSFFKNYDDIEYTIRLEKIIGKKFYCVQNAAYKHPPAKINCLRIGDIFLSVRNAHIVLNRYPLYFAKRVLSGKAYKKSKKDYLYYLPIIIFLEIVPIFLSVLSMIVGLKELATILIRGLIFFMISYGSPSKYLPQLSKTYYELKAKYDENLKVIDFEYTPLHQDIIISSKTYFKMFIKKIKNLYYENILLIDDEDFKITKFIKSFISIFSKIHKIIGKNSNMRIVLFIPPNYPKGLLYILTILALVKIFIRSKITALIIGPTEPKFIKIQS
jgi:GT2 family glycosyltransferase